MVGAFTRALRGAVRVPRDAPAHRVRAEHGEGDRAGGGYGPPQVVEWAYLELIASGGMLPELDVLHCAPLGDTAFARGTNRLDEGGLDSYEGGCPARVELSVSGRLVLLVWFRVWG